jgi:hypothetical protein
MAKKIRYALSFIVSSALLMACGGGQTETKTADEAAPSEEEGGADGPEAGDTAPSDGIKRDTDGDGVPDDQQGGGCAGKNETQCKINSACAWTDDGKCVEASSSPM